MPLHADAPTRARLLLADRRGRVEALLDLARFLPPADAALIEQVFRRGATAAEIARLAGTPPHVIQRRLRRLLLRLRHPLFLFAAAQGDLIPHRSRATVRRVVFHGWSLRRTARRTGQSLHQVRQHLRLLHALAHA